MSYRVALFGAAPDTFNLGVTALCHSAVRGLTQQLRDVEFVIFDNGRGMRSGAVSTAADAIPVAYCGVRGGRRYDRPENLSRLYLLAGLGRLGARASHSIRVIDSCAAVLDVSGGDSFSDLYGPQRFEKMTLPKLIALKRGKPLILLPQTYGPFRDPGARALAASIVKRASLAFARDPDSFAVLRDLLQEDYDPMRHLNGVDMAFGLPMTPPADKLPERLRPWLSRERLGSPLVGINVSGLIYNDPTEARDRYGLRADYVTLVNRLVHRLLLRSDARIVLIPHVMVEPPHPESDLAAALDVLSRVAPAYCNRIAVAPTQLDQNEVKGLIAKMEWFCGTRMHSTIAALSSGVPTAAISYSEKTRGVFATCGAADCVVDPKIEDTAAALESLWLRFTERAATRRRVSEQLPGIMAACRKQQAVIANTIAAGACPEPSGGEAQHTAQRPRASGTVMTL